MRRFFTGREATACIVPFSRVGAPDVLLHVSLTRRNLKILLRHGLVKLRYDAW